MPIEQRSAAYYVNALAQTRKPFFFKETMQFGEVTNAKITRDNARWILPQVLHTLHYSPEPSVIKQVIESATLLGQDELALFRMVRFRAAFAQEFCHWMQDSVRALRVASPPGAAPRFLTTARQ